LQISGDEGARRSLLGSEGCKERPSTNQAAQAIDMAFELFDGGIYNQAQTGEGEKKRETGARTVSVAVRAVKFEVPGRDLYYISDLLASYYLTVRHILIVLPCVSSTLLRGTSLQFCRSQSLTLNTD
jgi:hypothetical protein